MIKCIVFDFDGTLVDSKAVFVSIYNELAQKDGYTLMTSDNIEALRAMGIKERCTYLKIPVYKIPFIAAKFLKQYKASLPLLEFNPGVEELLKSLSAKEIAFAVLSSNAKNNISSFFEMKGLAVPDIFCSSNIFGKDRVLAKFLSSKKLSPSEILYVGDEERDVTACNKLGVHIAWVAWGYDTSEALDNVNPDYIIHTPKELKKLIKAVIA